MFNQKIKLGILIMLGSFAMFFSISSILHSADYIKIFKVKNNEALVSISVPTTYTTNVAEEKPKYFYLNKDQNSQPKINAVAYLVGDLNTGEVILAKNQDTKFPIASISKLTTALVTNLISNGDDVVEISKSALATEGRNGGLKLGEKNKNFGFILPSAFRI
jgi:D-alanyl-D-alanine carboxypeptidase